MKIKDGKVVIMAMACIAGLEAIALLNGIDGTLYMVVLSILAGLAGWTLPAPKFIKK